MAQTISTKVKELSQLSTEELEEALRYKNAQVRMKELATLVPDFKQNIAKVTDIKELIKMCRTFVYQYDSSNRVINPSSGKRGRPTGS